MTKQITDVTAYLLATGGVLIAAFCLSLLVWLIKKFFFDKVTAEVQKMSDLVSEAKSIVAKVEERDRQMDMELHLARLDERSQVIQSLLSGVTDSMVTVAQDQMQGFRREIQKSVREELEKELLNLRQSRPGAGK